MCTEKLARHRIMQIDHACHNEKVPIVGGGSQVRKDGPGHPCELDLRGSTNGKVEPLGHTHAMLQARVERRIR